MAIEYQSFFAFHEIVKEEVAPEGLAEGLIPYFRDQVGNALADIQTLIPWTREMNVDFHLKSGVNEFCATSIFQGPVGKVTQLFAYKAGVDCKKFYYKRVSTSQMECWIERQRCALCEATVPPSSNIYESPYCNYLIDGADGCNPPYLTDEEDDCRFKSLDDDERIFAVGPDYKIYAAPRFPCCYILCLQWQGVRRKWLDNYYVPVDQQVREAVVNYVEAKVAKKERDFTAKREYEDDYTINLRTIRYRYGDEQNPEAKRDCTTAIEQLMPAVMPAYETPFYGPASGCIAIPDVEVDLQQIFSSDSPPVQPDDPQQAALWYPTLGGTLLQWSITTQSWV